MKKILVFTATYNEKENIKKLITLIFKHCSNANVLIVDDNSPDKTAEEIELLKNEFKNISLIKRDSKLGLDTAHKFAYKYALDKGYDYLITMDADLSHDPAELTNFISSLETYPFVIGSRYAPGGECLISDE